MNDWGMVGNGWLRSVMVGFVLHTSIPPASPLSREIVNGGDKRVRKR